MFRSFFLILVALLLLAICVFVSPPITLSSSTTVVISEFRTRGPNGGNDEFIEFYNLSASPVDIGGWLVKGSNGSGLVDVRAIINSGTTAAPSAAITAPQVRIQIGPRHENPPLFQTTLPRLPQRQTMTPDPFHGIHRGCKVEATRPRFKKLD